MLLGSLSRWTATLDESYKIPAWHLLTVSYPLIPQTATYSSFTSPLLPSSKSSATQLILIFPNSFEQYVFIAEGGVNDFTHSVLLWNTRLIHERTSACNEKRTPLKASWINLLFCSGLAMCQEKFFVFSPHFDS